MPISHTNAAPRLLPFHAESFGREHFERFCAAWLISGTTLQNLGLTLHGPSRLRIADAVRYGTSGSKQKGIDILATMENGATWVVQCKRTPKFSRSDAEKAITKANTEYGSRNPAHFLLWVTGQVATGALDFVQQHPKWTLWDGERISQEFLLHTPRPQAFQIILNIFGSEWAKAFFPLPDHLLITTAEFYARWSGEDRLFHHEAAFVGRQELLKRVTSFGCGGIGSKALILSAPGGIGKTRLLRAVAERVEAECPGRSVRFTNPEASLDAEPPRDQEAAHLTVIHDDAHRLDTIPRLVLKILSSDQSTGSRLILATRPGAEDVLRELLMQFGYPSQKIETEKVGKLTKAEMEELAAANLGPNHSQAARPLAILSEGCALITLVGAELLSRGELTHLDLVRSDHFRSEVFHRFEGQELDRLRGSVDRPLLEKLLRSIALLSPWDNRDESASVEMAEFLGIQRGQVDAVSDSLLAGGLLVRTREGVRLTPDLFSDHLTYIACYDPTGKTTDFIQPFLNKFSEKHSQNVLRNLAEAEWRAIQQHGFSTTSVIASMWHRFLREFTQATFLNRSEMLKRWTAFSVYQPERSLQLANWALDLDKASQAEPGWGGWDNHHRVLEQIPSLLKPVAIWSDLHRKEAIGLLWRLRRDFPPEQTHSNNSPYDVFAEIASFRNNYPTAANAVLDWLEALLAGPDGPLAADRPSDFIGTVFRPFFARCIEQNYMQDARTMVFRKVPVSVSITKAVRQRAFRILTDQIIPRGTVASINALPALNAAFHQHEWLCDLTAAQIRAWLPEQRIALQAIQQVADRYPDAIVQHAIRRLLHWQAVYGKHEEFSPACRRIVEGLPDTFELRLARLSLSWCHDDSLDAYEDSNPADASALEFSKRQEEQWAYLTQHVASELIERYPDPDAIHSRLSLWLANCEDHGLSPRLGALLHEVTRTNAPLALGILDCIHRTPDSKLAYEASALIGHLTQDNENEIHSAIQLGLNSGNPVIVCSFLNSIQFRQDLRTGNVLKAVLHLARNADGSVLQALFQHLYYQSPHSWVEKLTEAILSQKLADQQAEAYQDRVYRWMQYEGGEITETTASWLIDRLSRSSKLDLKHDLSGFLHEMARKYPRKIFEMIAHRIERHEMAELPERLLFEPIPYAPGLTLRGIENEPDFESIARHLLHRIREATTDTQWMWSRLFTMTVSQTSSMLEALLMEWLPEVKDVDEMYDFTELIRFEGSLVIFSYPELTKAILTKARSFGPESYNRVVWMIIGSAGPQMRAYSNGELDPEYRYLRQEAEKAVQIHQSDPVLGPFFQKVLENEINDAQRNRLERESELTTDW